MPNKNRKLEILYLPSTGFQNLQIAQAAINRFFFLWKVAHRLITIDEVFMMVNQMMF